MNLKKDLDTEGPSQDPGDEGSPVEPDVEGSTSGQVESDGASVPTQSMEFDVRARRFWPIAVILVLLAGLGVGLFFAFSGGQSLTPLTAGNFQVQYPSDWQQATPPSSPASAGPAVGALKQVGGQGFIVFHKAGKAQPFTKQFVQHLNDQLKKTVADYQFASAQTLTIDGVKSFLFSYYQTQAKTLTSFTVIPDGQISWVIDTVSPSGSIQVATEIGTIIRSFKFT